ncbi:leucyl/phenylalanyl-tRNA--protein transferase [Kamptonema cortianum]|nr:leucyl/phenylalanyl-tRNA--protein transferase [Kamptonema cortianum]
MIHLPVILKPDILLPPRGALYRPKTTDGLCFIGGNLHPHNLLTAYRNGVFPWSAEPVTWWSPDPRAVFDLSTITPSRRLAQIIRQKKFHITFDTCFTRVIQECARPTDRRPETWIATAFVEAYSELHHAGHAHSCEVWHSDELVGGLYGVSIGGFFAGESMFTRMDNASSVGLFHLFDRLRSQGFQLFDSQVLNPHTHRMGAVEISRLEYLSRLRTALRANCPF